MHYISVYSLREKNLNDIIMEHKRIMIMFTGKKCISCRAFEPVINETLYVLGKKLGKENQGGIVEEYDVIQYVTVDIEEHQDLTDKFDITTMPYMIIFLDGEKIYEKSGIEPKLTNICVDLWKI